MSGAGKSTLVRCMNFLDSEGKVLIDGKALGDLTRRSCAAREKILE